jgi:hypothetical protein
MIVLGIFFLVLGIYFKITNQVIVSYDLYHKSGWQQTTMSGGFLLFLSLLCFGTRLWLNKVAKEEDRTD